MRLLLACVLALVVHSSAHAQIEITGTHASMTLDGSAGDIFVVNADIDSLAVQNNAQVVIESGVFHSVSFSSDIMVWHNGNFAGTGTINRSQENRLLRFYAKAGRVFAGNRPTETIVEAWMEGGDWLRAIVRRPTQSGNWPIEVESNGSPVDPTGNCFFDLEDLNLVRNTFGELAPAKGDVDQNGVVDLGDLNRVRNNFGNGFGPEFQGYCGGEIYAPITPVPEPDSIVIVGCLLASFVVGYSIARRGSY